MSLPHRHAHTLCPSSPHSPHLLVHPSPSPHLIVVSKGPHVVVGTAHSITRCLHAPSDVLQVVTVHLDDQNHLAILHRTGVLLGARPLALPCSISAIHPFAHGLLLERSPSPVAPNTPSLFTLRSALGELHPVEHSAADDHDDSVLFDVSPYLCDTRVRVRSSSARSSLVVMHGGDVYELQAATNAANFDVSTLTVHEQLLHSDFRLMRRRSTPPTTPPEQPPPLDHKPLTQTPSLHQLQFEHRWRLAYHHLAAPTSALLHGRRLLQQVQQLLSSSSPVPHLGADVPDDGSLEAVAAQQHRLLLFARRTLALGVGRGMLQLSTWRAVPSERLPVPPVVLDGAAHGIDHALLQGDLSWAHFHKGCAAGLRAAGACALQRPQRELTPQHAGLLLAHGAHGRLRDLPMPRVYDYLSTGDKVAAIGLLLGVAISYRGTSDAAVAKLLAIHVPALRPPNSPDLEVPHLTQAVALFSLGLLRAGTAHPPTADLLLSSIACKPHSETHFERRAYALCAGLGLGWLCLAAGRGCDVERLLHLAVGTAADTTTATAAPSTAAASSQLVLESPAAAHMIAAPGAIVAVGLMFLRTGDQAVSARLALPRTTYELERVAPLHLLLRVVARALVCWHTAADDPEAYLRDLLPPDVRSSSSSDVARRAVHSIDAGGCLALGLRRAGSGCQRTARVLRARLVAFARRWSDAKTRVDARAASDCLNACAVALGAVMAGRGCTESLRLLRTLRKRVQQDVTYGDHMAVGMAIGLLFLGGGCVTLGSSDHAVAALLCALYPRFAASSGDNEAYVQAMRVMYVLAAERRLTLAVDADTRQPVRARVRVDGAPLALPAFLPDSVAKIEVDSEHYCHRVVERGSSPADDWALDEAKAIFVTRRRDDDDDNNNDFAGYDDGELRRRCERELLLRPSHDDERQRAKTLDLLMRRAEKSAFWFESDARAVAERCVAATGADVEQVLAVLTTAK